MKNKLIEIITIITIAILSFNFIMPAYADGGGICGSDAATEVKEAAGCNATKSDIVIVVTNIINAVIGALGLVAVVFIVIGGVQYITSSGDSAKVQKAKNTILYACIGLVVAALAYAIVNFVIFILNGPIAGTEP